MFQGRCIGGQAGNRCGANFAQNSRKHRVTRCVRWKQELQDSQIHVWQKKDFISRVKVLYDSVLQPWLGKTCSPLWSSFGYVQWWNLRSSVSIQTHKEGQTWKVWNSDSFIFRGQMQNSAEQWWNKNEPINVQCSQLKLQTFCFLQELWRVGRVLNIHTTRRVTTGLLTLCAHCVSSRG